MENRYLIDSFRKQITEAIENSSHEEIEQYLKFVEAMKQAIPKHWKTYEESIGMYDEVIALIKEHL